MPTWWSAVFLLWSFCGNCKRTYAVMTRGCWKLSLEWSSSKSHWACFVFPLGAGPNCYALYIQNAALFFYCCRCDGPAEGTPLRLPGNRGAHAPHSPQQQAGNPRTYLPALEMEEKEEWEAEAELYGWMERGVTDWSLLLFVPFILSNNQTPVNHSPVKGCVRPETVRG